MVEVTKEVYEKLEADWQPKNEISLFDGGF